MKKIRLDPEQLRVESFEPDPSEPPVRGTVHGHWSQIGTCDGRVKTCQFGGTCGPGCETANCTGSYCV